MGYTIRETNDADLEIQTSGRPEKNVYISDLGTDNLVTNGDMEIDSNWSNYGSPSTNERSSEQKHTGTYSRKIVLGVGGADGISQQQTLVIGKKYKVTAWVYGGSLTSGEFRLRLGTDIATASWSNGEWVKLEGTKVATVTNHDVVVYMSSGTATTSFYIDDVSIIQYTDLTVGGDIRVSGHHELSLLDEVKAAVEGIPMRDVDIAISYYTSGGEIGFPEDITITDNSSARTNISGQGTMVYDDQNDYRPEYFEYVFDNYDFKVKEEYEYDVNDNIDEIKRTILEKT